LIKQESKEKSKTDEGDERKYFMVGVTLVQERDQEPEPGRRKITGKTLVDSHRTNNTLLTTISLIFELEVNSKDDNPVFQVSQHSPSRAGIIADR